MDVALAKAQEGTARLGPKRDGLKAQIQALSQQFEDSKKLLVQLQVDRKSLELDIEAKDAVVRKSAGDLNSAKSNDTYKALLTQIEDAKKAKAEIEDRVLEIMEKTDQMQKDSKEREKNFQQQKAAVEAQIGEIDAEEQRLKAEAEEKTAARDAYYQTLPEPSRVLYDRIQRGRQGMTVIVPVIDTICGGCHMKLPPGLINNIVKGGEIMNCEGCTRLLYMPPKEEKPAAEAQNASAAS